MRFLLGILLVTVMGAGAFEGANRARLEYRNLVVSGQQQADEYRKSATKNSEQIAALDKTLSGMVAQSRRAQILAPDLAGDSVSVSVAIERETRSPLAPVSITRIAKHQFLVADYQKIFLFDESEARLTNVTLNGSVPIWAPTAVFYSTFYDLVFIANYTGGDVVVAKLHRDGATVSLELVSRITDKEGIKGPEGVAISRGGRFMALADYLGNQVSLFERKNNAWVRRWSRTLTSAHAIAIVGRYVYAGGTSIVKFNIEDGVEAAKTNTLGGHPILFATCLHEDRTTGDLIGSDAMAGRVFVMSPNLEVKTSFGANGPTFANLSMPYCAIRDEKATYVLSTYQDRVLKIDGQNTTSFEFAAPHWQYMTPTPNSADMWEGVVKYDSPEFKIFGKQVRPSYGSLRAADGTTFLLPGRLSVNRSPWPFYLVTIAQKGDWLAIVANSSPLALLYNRETESLVSAELNDWDCWAASDRVLCPTGEVSIGSLIAESTAISDEPAPAGAAKSMKAWQGTMVPMLDYWRAWKATTD